MLKADYSKIASFYDKGRTLSEQNMNMWIGHISSLSGLKHGDSILDLGCGTGRFAIPIGRDLGFRVTGADSSKEMLAKAREKDKGGLVTWDCVEAHALKYHDNSFDVLFMSHLLHHLDNPAAVIDECQRVLKPSGVILIRYGAMEQIRDDVEADVPGDDGRAQSHVLFPHQVTQDQPV